MATSTPPRVLSGIQPTGTGLHLGNYLGAVRNWVGLQADHDAFYFIPDLHAITVPHDPAELRRRTVEAAAELLACGLDPGRCTLFVQSHVPEHAELGWVMGCLTGFGEASRMTQFKDKSGRADLGAATVGLFTYPMLQAADILLYQADLVPVGADQRQHLELTRDLAQRFNRRFGPAFRVPGPYLVHNAQRITDLADPEVKMSKSRPPSGTVYLLDEPATIAKKIRSAVTDTGREVRAAADKPGIANLLSILSAVCDQPVPALEERYAGRGYGDFKADVASAVSDALAPIRARYAALMGDPEQVLAILADGGKRARVVAAATMSVVRDRLGLLPVRD
ncbi:MAG: tryptophan--tRNA ligase [Mycobacteriales bacterium]